jgi:membrane associated rhomboid family serine protease
MAEVPAARGFARRGDAGTCPWGGGSTRSANANQNDDASMSFQTRPGFDSFGIGLTPTPMVKRLLIANTLVYAVGLIVGEGFMLNWFAFQPRELVFRPWGPLTYMFLHGDLWHLFGNMLFLFFFGPPLEARWGAREFTTFYFICGLGGAAMSFLLPGAPIIGASGALLGVMVAFAMNWPDAPIYFWGIFPIPAKYLVAFFVVMDILGARSGSQGGGIAHFAHLGGALTGFLYLKADWRPREKLRQLQSATRRRRLAIVPRDETEQEETSASRAGGRASREDAALYDRVDAVLDKISAEGMSSLTPAELQLLDEVSKRHRSN